MSLLPSWGQSPGHGFDHVSLGSVSRGSDEQRKAGYQSWRRERRNAAIAAIARTDPRATFRSTDAPASCMAQQNGRADATVRDAELLFS